MSRFLGMVFLGLSTGAFLGCLANIKLDNLQTPAVHSGIRISSIMPASPAGYVFPYQLGLLRTGERVLIAGVDGPVVIAGRQIPTTPDSYHVLVLDANESFLYHQSWACPQTLGPAFHSSPAHGVWLGCVVSAVPLGPSRPRDAANDITLSRVEQTSVKQVVKTQVTQIQNLRTVLPLRDGSFFLLGQAPQGGIGLARISNDGKVLGETNITELDGIELPAYELFSGDVVFSALLGKIFGPDNQLYVTRMNPHDFTKRWGTALPEVERMKAATTNGPKIALDVNGRTLYASELMRVVAEGKRGFGPGFFTMDVETGEVRSSAIFAKEGECTVHSLVAKPRGGVDMIFGLDPSDTGGTRATIGDYSFENGDKYDHDLVLASFDWRGRVTHAEHWIAESKESTKSSMVWSQYTPDGRRIVVGNLFRSLSVRGFELIGQHRIEPCGAKEPKCLSALQRDGDNVTEADKEACCQPQVRAASVTFVMEFDRE